MILLRINLSILLCNFITLWGIDNETLDSMTSFLSIQERNCDSENLSLVLTSSNFVEAKPNEIIFVSAVIKNSSLEEKSEDIQLLVPNEWSVIPSNLVKINCLANESNLQIFAVKIPASTLSNDYELKLKLGNQIEIIKISILPIKEFTVKIENEKEIYPNTPLELKINCINNSNVPLKIGSEINLDPICDVSYNRSPIVILPQDECQIRIEINPHFELGKYKQFLLLKIIDLDTSEFLFQRSFCLNFISANASEEDLYVRIPSICSFVAIGDQEDYSLGVEFAGAGTIDEQRERYLEYYFFLPTDSQKILSYDLDQTVFFGMSEPDWNLRLGDTMYFLSPLTQYRYGRGAGLDLYGEYISAGAHYTQNQCESDYNLKEVCSFVELFPYNWMGVSGNYFHKEEECIPTADIVTFETEFDLPNKIYIDCEYGNNFIKHPGSHDTRAVYVELDGNNFNDIWWNIQKVYAGSAFFGYYNYMNLFSAIIDFPLKSKMRASLSTTRLRQNLINRCCSSDYSLSPWQKQYNGNLSYQFSERTSIGVNGLLLRAKDRNACKQYDFFQKWLRFSYATSHETYNLNVMPSFGAQEDYLKAGKESFLQQYYVFLGKSFLPNLQGAFIYDGGNTNYYHAKHWKNAWGGSLNYSYQLGGHLSVFLQRIQSRGEGWIGSQAFINLNHTFRNLNTLKIFTQYFHYETGGCNELLFLVSYSIPFDLIAAKRTDIGNLKGYVYDVWRRNPISNAMVSLGDKQTFSDEDGRFSFSNIPVGQQQLKAIILPEEMITQIEKQSVRIIGGKEMQVTMAVVPVCSISGEVILYSEKDPFERLKNRLNSCEEESILIEKGALKNISIIIRNSDTQEEYTTVSNVFGRFHFPGLRPGVWQVMINKETLPEEHIIDIEEEIIETIPEDKKTVIFKVLPKTREIELLN